MSQILMLLDICFRENMIIYFLNITEQILLFSSGPYHWSNDMISSSFKGPVIQVINPLLVAFKSDQAFC